MPYPCSEEESSTNEPPVSRMRISVTGNPSRHSDIDLQIILEPGAKWRERGNKIIHGFLIEYFANPPEKVREYFREEWKDRKQYTVHMLATGKILFGNSAVRKLVREAKRWLARPFKKMGKFEVESSKYHIWDLHDNLEEVYESKRPDFDFVYFNSLYQVFEIYAKYLRYPSAAIHKVYLFLTSKTHQKKYMVPEFPDKKFTDLFLRAISERSRKKKMELFRQIVKHVHRKMGGFQLDGWKLRSSA